VLTVGGYHTSNMDSVEEYDSFSNSWTIKVPTLLVARHQAASVSVPAYSNWFNHLPNGCRGVL